MIRNRSLAVAALTIATSFALAAGCGDDSGGTGGSGSNCGTTASPEILTVTERSPAAESLVVNEAIQHRFRIVGAPGIFQNMSFELPASHTAGAPIPQQLSFTITQDGDDLVYEGAPMAWTTAPGRVEMSIQGAFEASDGCVYAFPSPLFSYDLDDAGEGGGGEGGAGEGGAGGA